MSGKIIAKVRAQQAVAWRNRLQKMRDEVFREQSKWQIEEMRNMIDAAKARGELAHAQPNKVRSWWEFWRWD